jgi:8-oxo-dGTP pyrophosphatase MutT (NUDIX family)
MNNLNLLTEEEIECRLRNQIPPTYDVPSSYLGEQCRKAAVLIPFVRIEDSWQILFIRRAESDKDRHSGQVAFVGGKTEEYDPSPEATALRETQEEIGVAPEHVHILGQLSHHYSISQFQITPFVGTLAWPYDLKLDSSEVSHTFTLPLNWLANDNNFEVHYRQLSKEQKPVPVIYFNEYQGELLWGATARMTLALVKMLKLNP